MRQRTLALETEQWPEIRLQRELLKITERERSTIGHDLHDGLCQHLAGTALATQVLAERLAGASPELAEQARGIVTLVEDGIAQTRTLANGLLLVSIDPDRLIAELEKLATSVSTIHGVPCQMTVRGDPVPPGKTAASDLFRIAQEAVRNALRHARPARQDARCRGDPGRPHFVGLGQRSGLPPKRRRSPGCGVTHHRPLPRGNHHGELTLESAAGSGTRCAAAFRPAPP